MANDFTSSKGPIWSPTVCRLLPVPSLNLGLQKPDTVILRQPSSTAGNVLGNGDTLSHPRVCFEQHVIRLARARV